MIRKAAAALALCLCLLLFLTAASAEDVTLKINGMSVSVPADSEEVDLGALAVPNTDEGFNALYAFLDRLPAVKRVNMFSTDIHQERLEPLAARYPDVEFGWTIYIPCVNGLRSDRGSHRLRTDATAFSTLHNISCTSHDEKVWEVLKYCKNLEALDIGHNNTLRDISFLRYVPNLKVLVISFNHFITDISAIGGLKELQYLEICKNEIHDISPLANCTKLVDLNICTNRVKDLSPLYGLKNLRRLFVFSCMNFSQKPIPKEEITGLKAALPDCVIDNKSINTGGPWKKHPRYDTVAKIFGYTTKAVKLPQAYIPFDSLD